jgi:phosphonate transport system substrate-binding protein
MNFKRSLSLFKPTWLLMLIVSAAIVAGACSSDTEERTLYIAGIPDQDISLLETRFGKLAEYLSQETGLDVKYLPSVDYAAVVTGFRQGDIQLAWYGGLTGVQARLASPGSQAIAQRQEDEAFHSVFIAQKGLGIASLADLKGRSVTFGSESSTSGNLMPRSFLAQAGINPENDFSAVNYSGSHDKTWKLVETGAFEAGALNARVWEKRVADGSVDTNKVEAFFTTPPYYDYHWVIRGEVDAEFGAGTTSKLTKALLELLASDGGREQEIMGAFGSTRFISTNNENYAAIEQVARDLGIIEK